MFARRTLGSSGGKLNIASRLKEMYGEKLFRGTRKRFLREINAFLPSFLSRMDLGNVDMWNMQVFV